ncbi:MAG TPA: PstS family phosphate ABC transporter substrate-binding protein [Campylobacterales bacterium]|nr:PstS family phosphate ABC transporter substrate-binding protein [Campylobacterales bacterium]
MLNAKGDLHVSMRNILHHTLILSLVCSTLWGQRDELQGIIPYTPQEEKSSVYGALSCRGSTNVGQFLKVWLSDFQKIYPHIQTHSDFTGSSRGLKALMHEEANIGATSRPIRNSEIQIFKEMRGYAPTEIKVSLDALAIYVNRLNKIESISLEELDAIFSRTRNRGYPHAITNWSMLGDSNGTINMYLFNKQSGTRYYFQHQVLWRGVYTRDNIVSDQYTTTQEIVDQVSQDKNGIGFGSAGINNFKVKPLAIAKRAHYPTYTPTAPSIRSGNYPLTRYFYLYLDVPPDKPIPTILYEFCKFVLSQDGQKVVLRNRGFPLSPQQIGTELAKLRRE